MKTALIGATGFVGTTLQTQCRFTHLYNSKNIGEIGGKVFDLVVCAGAPAQKWLANQQPEQDKKNMNLLIQSLSQIKCKMFILISTVDVFKTPIAVNESSPIELQDLQPYGLHRYELERFITNQFEHTMIVRLPGLVGPGLKKNVIYDFLHQNNLEAIHSDNIFQFYPMQFLWRDIKIARDNALDLIHLTAEPILVETVAKRGFDTNFDNKLDYTPVKYDFQTQHAALFHQTIPYQYSVVDSISAIRHYAQNELATL